MEEKEELSFLEEKKKYLLIKQEMLWRLKSRAIWIALGDENMSFFQNYGSYRRNINTIWDLQLENGQVIHRDEDLKEADINHFQNQSGDQGRCDISAQLEIIKHFPSIFSREEGEHIGKPVTLEEIESILKLFAKDKSPGLDGWTVEIFSAFFDIMGRDLL